MANCAVCFAALMFSQSQTYFSQAVIFIFTHSESGSAGLILNRPTEFTLGKVAGAEEMCPEFAESQLRLGGDVGKSTLNILHSYGELEGAIEIVNGIYLGGFEAARRAVREGNAQGKDFTWFMHHAGWGPGQLENECSSGVWFTAAAGRDLILQPRDGNDAPADMWHEVLQLMGGEYSELSKVVQQPYRADIMGNEGREGEDV
ncbi:unnamed protein product [Ostreobium quekettii]|uniref:Uncharacterized protein n=1 Tax=Ostreobium quekettii TaxID=121088 RepID=A0A8S1J249_9CHLO|nr:unnamed protein product [Ostreobium quekettii]